MSSLMSLWLGLAMLLAGGSPPAPAPSFRVCADLGHSGKLSGPLTSSWRPEKDFCIVTPLPTRATDRGFLAEHPDRGEEFVSRLGRVRVETARGSGDINVEIETENRRWLSLFRKTDGGWRRVAPNLEKSWTLSPGEDGTLELGVGVILLESSAPGTQGAWPRAFTVAVSTEVRKGEQVRVPFRVAPFLIPSALEPVEELLIVSQPVTADSVRAVQAFATKTDVTLNVFRVDVSCDQWMQDTIQPGLFAFPTAAGTGQARVVLAGLRREAGRAQASLDNQVARRLRRQGIVTVGPGIPRKKTRWVDGYGNIEATPPFKDRQGRQFRYGRLITGRQGELAMHPGVMKFLEAQGFQWPPIVVDTSWLLIGHVDEVVNFVPARGEPGFKVLLPSPKKARELLDGLLAKGLEKAPVFAGTEEETTLGKLQTTVAGSTENLAIDETIERIRGQLKTELNLDDGDFVMLPTVFRRGMALIPNPVNSMAVNGHLLVAAPRGPRQDGKDFFETAIREALGGCDVRVVFIESWGSYHASGGEIHCGTNTFRRLRDPAWWTEEARVSESLPQHTR